MAASSKKFGIEFSGFSEVVNRLNKLQADVPAVTEKALKATHAHVTPQLHELMKAHEQTGNTEKSIVDTANVEWTGTVAKVEVGFDISNGGLPSIFLMYGTPRHMGANQYGDHGKSVGGTKADAKLKAAVFGSSTKKEIMKIQEDIFYDALRRSSG